MVRGNSGLCKEKRWGMRDARPINLISTALALHTSSLICRASHTINHNELHLSRWKEEFEPHPIHEILKQSQEWLNTKIENIDDDHAIERRSLINVLNIFKAEIKSVDCLGSGPINGITPVIHQIAATPRGTSTAVHQDSMENTF